MTSHYADPPEQLDQPGTEQVVIVDNVTAVVNYGLDRVRFPAPVPVDYS